MQMIRQIFLFLPQSDYAWTSEKEKNLEKLLNEADEAMYENKKELKKERD